MLAVAGILAGLDGVPDSFQTGALFHGILSVEVRVSHHENVSVQVRRICHGRISVLVGEASHGLYGGGYRVHRPAWF